MFLLCSCHLRQVPLPQAEIQVKVVYKIDYKYKKAAQYNYQEELIDRSSRGQIIEYKLEANDQLLLDERQIHLKAYINSDPKSHLLLIQPISKGKYRISEFVANYFFARGWSCMIVKREEAYKKLFTPEALNLQMNELLLDSRHIIDFLENEKPFEYSDIAMFGISKGGIKTSMIIGYEKRIKAAVIVLAGGDLPNLLTESKEKGIIKARKKYMAENESDLDSLRGELREKLTVDPLLMAPYIDGSRTLHILAYFDRSVPYYYGEQLFEAMPGAKSYTMLAGHYSAILFLPFILNRSEAFYEKKLVRVE
ncbi:hypothetical protein LNTAR_18183 [Lentisphaera araneosa HTCC2155]|uniref:Peptidase S9 prolyl oligopeptidase catalytic domain-containing protein n=2 Tax=Lentisphaera TaxID=256846 RepID=A6DFX5_9BACT|nr:hypothetical protein LNTAR_18183 [Lentisphaera araneosa HTCC2155]